MKTFLKILLFVVSMPLMLVLVFLESKYLIDTAGSYGIFVWGGVLVAALVTVVCTLTYVITAAQAHKAKTIKKVRVGTAAMVIVSLFFTVGVWRIIDAVLPDIFENATDHTITFDMIREDYNHRADVHMNLLNTFIRENYANGTLDEMSLEEYLDEGYANQEVRDLIAQRFTSMDAGGYKTFKANGPWLDLANSSRLTIPTLVHLIINERETEAYPFYLIAERVTYKKDPETGAYYWLDDQGNRVPARDKNGTNIYTIDDRSDDTLEMVNWTILDMQGGTMNISLEGLLSGLGDISGILGTVQSLVGNMIEGIENALAEFIARPEVAGSYIFVDLDLDKLQVNLISTTEERGVLGYQNMAWFNSNHLLLLITSLFPARNIMYVFGAVGVLCSLCIGAIRESQFRKRKGLKADGEEAPAKSEGEGNAIPVTPAPVEEKSDLTPYMRTYAEAHQVYRSHLNKDQLNK